MKTTLKRILVVLTVAVLLFTMVSCNKAESIKKAFEKEGYTVKSFAADSEDAKTFAKMLDLSEEEEKNLSKYEFILANKDAEGNGLADIIGSAMPDVLIIKFPSAGDLKDFLIVEKDGEKNTEAYDKAKDEGMINGNCLLIPLVLNTDFKDTVNSMIELFNK